MANCDLSYIPALSHTVGMIWTDSRITSSLVHLRAHSIMGCPRLVINPSSPEGGGGGGVYRKRAAGPDRAHEGSWGSHDESAAFKSCQYLLEFQ